MLIKRNRKTLKELVDRDINYKALFRILIHIDEKLDRTVIGWRGLYKKAIRAIRELEPLPELRHCFLEAKYSSEWPCCMMEIEGTDWQESISREIYRGLGVKCSDLEITAVGLWHITFYGFTPELQDKQFKEKLKRDDEYFEEQNNRPLRLKRRKERKLKRQLITQYWKRVYRII